MKALPKPLIITAGEPAGIGPDIILQLKALHPSLECLVMADINLLKERAQLLNLNIPLVAYNPQLPLTPEYLAVQHVSLRTQCIPGQLNPANASYVLECLNLAIEGCLTNKFLALITGPVHKGIINEAGISFSGHTEYLAEITHSPLPVMLLIAGSMRVALLTTHLPLTLVAKAVTADKISQTIKILAHDLTYRFHLLSPRIAVCGLNPHAGENGRLGREEIEIITPTLNKLREQGYQLVGPISADTAFTSRALQQCDAVLAMYHDQGLPVIKAQSFGMAVNVTLGLPIVRTSVDHGTALELAGTGLSDPNSLMAAIQLAIQITATSHQHFSCC